MKKHYVIVQIVDNKDVLTSKEARQFVQNCVNKGFDTGLPMNCGILRADVQVPDVTSVPQAAGTIAKLRSVQ